MKEEGGMKYFDYVEPQTLNEACQLLRTHEESKILAGGASLLVLIKNRLITPSLLVNIKTIPGLNRIEWDDQKGLLIGSLNRHRDVMNSPIIKKHFPLLSEAASKISTPSIRNIGTIGGNLCHSDPSADFPPALIAVNAKLRTVSLEGERIIPIEHFFKDYYENILKQDEILVEIQIPRLPSKRSGGVYLKLDKITNSMAIVGVASIICLDETGICTFVGVGLGGVGPTPLKVEKIREIFLGERVKEIHIEEAAKEAQAICNPLTDVYGTLEYRKEMVQVLTRRALQEALKRAQTV